MDPGRAPQRVFPAHPLDQITQATIDLRPPCPMSRFPTPESFEPGAMPPKDGLRLHHLGQITQIGADPRDPYQQRPVTNAAAHEATPACRVMPALPHRRQALANQGCFSRGSPAGR